MIKEIKTEKFEGLAVLVPDEFEEYAGANNNELFYWTKICTQIMGDYPHSVHVPNVKDYEFLGKASELTEEQCEGIVPNPMTRILDEKMGFMADVMDVEIYKTAKEAFEQLMILERSYFKNPFGEDLCSHNRQCYDSCQGCCWTRAEIDSEEWEEAEKQTGTWIILEKL